MHITFSGTTILHYVVACADSLSQRVPTRARFENKFQGNAQNCTKFLDVRAIHVRKPSTFRYWEIVDAIYDV